MSFSVYLDELNGTSSSTGEKLRNDYVADDGVWTEHEEPSDEALIVVDVKQAGRRTWQVHREGTSQLHVVPTREDAVRLAAELASEG